jgi:hypothetical protein
MRQFWALGLMAVLAGALAGCQFGGLNGGESAEADIAAPTALQGPAVEVTTLAPMGQTAAPVVEAKPVVPAVSPKDVPPKDAPQVAPKADVPTAAALTDAAPVVAPVKSPSQIACEKKGGHFASLPNRGAMTCQMPTRDGGKQCRRESDCDGVCLARSRTCAPVKPLLGCQDILQNDGRRVKLCID